MKKLTHLGVLFVVATVSFAGCGGPGPQNEAGNPNAAADGENAGSDGLDQAENASADSEAKDIVDTAVAAGDFNTLATALKAAGLIDTLRSEGPFTVFAPTDAAFAKLPKGTVDNLLKPENKDQLVSILTYHVIAGKVDAETASSLDSADTVNGAALSISADGGTVKINDATVTKADINCSNGIIHVIDSVILPPSGNTEAASKKTHAGEPLSVEGVGSFSTLFAAIEAAGLKETLEKDGPFTVFAPTDRAFAALPEGTVENLLKPENKEQLTAILTYHVVPGEVKSGQVVKVDSVTTVHGGKLSIKVAGEKVTVNEAAVLKTDIPCEVGLIHAIDKVLMP